MSTGITRLTNDESMELMKTRGKSLFKGLGKFTENKQSQVELPEECLGHRVLQYRSGNVEIQVYYTRQWGCTELKCQSKDRVFLDAVTHTPDGLRMGMWVPK